MAINRDKILREAEKLVQKGKVEQAIREYEKLLKANPNDANTINRVGDLYGRIGQVEKAIELYERIAEHFTQDGFTTKAIAILKKINRLAPQRLDIFNRLAELYIQQGLIVEAKSQLQMLAEWYTRNEDNEQAIEIHKKLVGLDPNNHMANLRLADLLMQAEQPEEGVEVYGRLGTMLLERNKLDEAERLYKHALEQNPPTGEFLVPLCSALLEAGRTDSARKFLDAAIERSPDSTDLQLMEVRTQVVHGNAADALDHARRLLEDDPENEEIRGLVGRVLLASGDMAEAKELLVPSAERLLGRSDFNGAQQVLQELLKEMPQDAEVLGVALRAFEPSGDDEMVFTLKAALADSHFRGDNENAAKRLYLDLLGVEPDNALFRQRLAQIDGAAPEEVEELVVAGDGDDVEAEAAEVGEEIVEIEFTDGAVAVDDEEPDAAVEQPVEAAATERPFDPQERMAEANVFAKYGLLDKAIHHLQEVVDACPDHYDALEKLVLLYVELENPESALRIAGPLVEHYRDSSNDSALETLQNLLPQLGQEAPPVEKEPAVEIEQEDAGVLVLDLGVGSEKEAPELVPSEVEAAASDVVLEFEIDDAEAGADRDAVAIADNESPEPAPVEVEVEAEAPVDFEVEAEAPVDFEPVVEAPVDFEPASAEPVDLDGAVAGPVELADDEPGPIELEGLVDAEEEIESLDDAFVVDLDAVEAEPVSDNVDTPLIGDLRDLEQAALNQASNLLAPADELSPIADVISQVTPAPATRPTDDRTAATETPVKEELVEISTSFTGPSLSDLQQIDFFVDQELYDDAIRLLQRLEEEFPDDADVAQRRLTLKSKGVLLDKVTVGAEASEDLFADEEEYFDLAKELEEELAEEEAMVEEATGRGKDEALLEEVFREFQKGVSEQLSEEDSDTHFNLGIAYKEMGLLPEAIREFQVAARDPAYFIECCSMIGVCYVDQGMSDQAASWYRKALEAPDVTAEAGLALRYDLALAVETTGDTAQAIDLFEEIAAIQPTYRDVSTRLITLSQQRQVN